MQFQEFRYRGLINKESGSDDPAFAIYNHLYTN